MWLRDHGVHLSYCTNIHPGETWQEIRRNLGTHVRDVQARIGSGAPFGVGLRLSGVAARTLAEGHTLDELRRFLVDSSLYVFTINGFPYGPFHGTRVKEDVYLPDWLDDERLRYTDQLAAVLAALLPDGVSGSISTVPGAFRNRVRGAADEERIVDRLLAHVATLHRIQSETGRDVELALEPEPRCFLETTEEAVQFFDTRVFTDARVRALAAETGLSTAAADGFLRRHLGLCLDACHMAVEFEDPVAELARVQAAGVRVGKVQLSAGLEVKLPCDVEEAERTLAALAPFAEGVYLHQAVERGDDGSLARYLDLPDAIDAARARAAARTLRVHFHVPIFAARLERFGSTQPFLGALLDRVLSTHATAHLEVETYTWDVLPAEHRDRAVADAVAAELRWVLSRMDAGRPAAAGFAER